MSFISRIQAKWRDAAVRRKIVASGLFDAKWYLERYPDVAATGVDPLDHYLRFGAAEGRDAGPKFSTRRYLDSYPDVAESGTNALYHYVSFGIFENRTWRTPRSIRDFHRKLWGGFADVTIPTLTSIVDSKAESPEMRAAAAWELCRYFMAIDNISEAAALISKTRRLSKELMRGLRPQLVEIELLTMTGDMVEARKRLARCSAVPANQNNAALSQANLVNREGSSTRQHGVLAAINEMFAREAVSQIAFGPGVDGPQFARLDCDSRTLRFVDEPQCISVLMAAFNAEQHLELALGSVQKQTWRNVEIIVVDDASTDRTFEIATRIANSDPRVRVMRNSQNMGAYSSRNRALMAATGDIITVHDSDDWSHPEMLERQAKLLISNPKLHGTFSMMCRATDDLVFQLRPARDVLEFIHRSYPSLMMRRQDVLALGAWDGVRANADDEFVQRARRRFGVDAFADANQAVPLSIFLTHERSLTQSADTSLRSLTFGVRHEYGRSAAHWYKSQPGDDLTAVQPRVDRKTPFPCPELLLPHALRGSKKYDIIIISDLSLLGGTRSCNLGYIDTALAMGLKVGLFHWPRGDLQLLPDVAPAYRERNKQERCTILTWEEEVEARALVIHHPPILKYTLDRLPRIKTNAVYILTNQLPRQVTQQVDLYYSIEQVDRDLERLFGHRPVWIAISPLVRRVLKEYAPAIRLLDEIWYPPYGELSRFESHASQSRQAPVIGRHGRDHWTKWPSDASDIAAAYCADSSMKVRILGGAHSAQSTLGRTPPNWEILPFDSVDVSEFLRSFDIFVNFNNRDYIEEFGRNCMEAMAAGIPVIAAPEFSETFGEAVVPAQPTEVQQRVRELWASKQKYAEQAARGYAFVEANCVSSRVRERLERLLASTRVPQQTNMQAVDPPTDTRPHA